MLNKTNFKETNRYFIISFFIIISLLSIILAYQIKNIRFYEWIRLFTYILLVNLIVQLLALKLVGIKLFSLTGLFLILTYLFHYGQLFIMGLFPNYEFKTFNYFEFYNINTLKDASIFAFLIIIMVNLGFIISSRFYYKKEYTVNSFDIELSLYMCRKIGWILIFFLFPLELYIETTKVLISFSQGYLSTYGLGLPGFVGAIASMSYIGFALILLGYSKDKKKSFYILSFIVLYLFLTMLSGHRGHQLTMILFYVYIYLNYINKIKPQNILLTIFFFYLVVVLLNSIKDYRGIINKNIEELIKVFFNNLSGNSFKNLITELGGTIKTLYLTLKQVPYNQPHTWGINYFYGFFSILPDVGNIFEDINNFATFTKNLSGHALGGSYIAELYFNFSYYGIFFAVFIGVFVNNISQKIDNLLRSKKYFKAIYYFPLFQYILWWVRDAFPSMLRPYFWSLITLYLLSNYLNFKKIER